MGILMGALAGAGKAAGEIADANTRLWGQKELQQQNHDLEIAKQKLLMEFGEKRAIAAEDRAQEPLKRFGGLVKGNQDTDVPMTAEPVTQLSGNGLMMDGKQLQGKGFVGNLEKLRTQIAGMPESTDKTNMLKQLDSQIVADTDTAQKGILGQTRKMTSDEALTKTRQDALANDPVALAAYEKTLGESSRRERKLDAQDVRNEKQQDIKNRQLDIAQLKNETQQEFNNRREDRRDLLAENQMADSRARADRAEGKQDTALERAELNSRRQSTVELMKSTSHEIERTMSLANSAIDPAAAKGYQDRVARLTQDLTAYRSALESFTGGAVKREDVKQDAPPEGTRGVFEGKKGVVKNGVFVADGAESKPDKTAKPQKTAEPDYVPPADSPAGKRLAEIGARQGAAQATQQNMQQQAQAALDRVGTDPSAASDLQSSALFRHLSADQKLKLYKLVNGK